MITGSSAGNPLVPNALLPHTRTLWEASPLGDRTAQNLRPEAGFPQGRPLKQHQSDHLRSFGANQEGFFTTKNTKNTKIAWVGLVVIEAHHGKALCAVRFSRRGVALDWMVARAAPP